MFSLLNILTFASLVFALSPPAQRQYIFENPSLVASGGYDIPSTRQSAVLARRILSLTPLGTLATVFPAKAGSTEQHAAEHRPSGLAGMPIGLMDYIADCERPSAGNPTILAINIATSFKNVAAGSNISLSLRWTPPYPPRKRITLRSFLPWLASSESLPYSAANLPRFSLLGYLEKISAEEADDSELRSCFTQTHPDAKYWLPGNRIHESEWVRLVIQQVYWIGGFGDRAYIGWIPVEEWRNVTQEDLEKARLPGEKKGWKEWSAESWDL